MESKTVETGGGRHFVTGDFKSHADFMSDEDYAKALDNVVIACVDCIVLNNNKMLLGKRDIEPQPDWWIIGGRMKPGESFEVAAARNIKRETSLDIDIPRFHYLGAYSFVWARRAQTPKENGSHAVSITMVLRISDDELAGIKLNDEYQKSQWLLPQDVMNGSFHPAVIKYAEDLIVFISAKA